MTETPKLSRLVICLLYAACGLMRRVKRPREQLVMTDSVGQHRSDYQLSVAGALRQSTGVVSDSFFESDRTASEAVAKRRIRRNPVEKNRSKTINYIVGSVGNR